MGSKGHEFKEQLIRAIPKTPVRLYFPSEFGVDHYVHDFPHPEWGAKKEHLALAKQLLSPLKVKICRVFCGLFLEDSIGPWFGFNTRHGVYESVGSAEKGISFTSLEDVGKTVAQLASTSETVPDVIHIGGDTRSIRQIASCMNASGAGKIEIRELDLSEYKAKAVHKPTPDPAQCLRFLMGEGKINHTAKGLGNDNDLVDPGQKTWKWKTLTELASDTGGKPWKDYEWPPAA